MEVRSWSGSIVFFLSSLLFQIFRLRIPGTEELVMQVRLIRGFYLGFPRVLLHVLEPIFSKCKIFFFPLTNSRSQSQASLSAIVAFQLVEVVKPAVMLFCLQRDQFFTSTCVFISVVFFPSSLLFQICRLSVPGQDIDSYDDSSRAGSDGKGSIWASLEYYYTS